MQCHITYLILYTFWSLRDYISWAEVSTELPLMLGQCVNSVSAKPWASPKLSLCNPQ